MPHPIFDPLPDGVRLDTVAAWVRKNGSYPAIIAYQFRDECRNEGITNWPWVLAWASVATGHFSDKRWLHEIQLPHPNDGAWPTKGSTTMRQEIRLLCRRMAAIGRGGGQVWKHRATETEYELLVKLAQDFGGDRRDPVPPPPKPPVPRPNPPPTPEPEKPKPPAREGLPPWVKRIAAYASVLLPAVTLILWLAPLPGPVKTAIRMILEFLAGMAG